MELYYRKQRKLAEQLYIVFAGSAIFCFLFVSVVGKGLYMYWWPIQFFEPLVFTAGFIFISAMFIVVTAFWAVVLMLVRRDASLILLVFHLLFFATLGVFLSGVLCTYINENSSLEKDEIYLSSAISEYDNKESLLMDAIQINVKCCGIRNHGDWMKIKNYKCDQFLSNSSLWTCELPNSCLRTDESLQPIISPGGQTVPILPQGVGYYQISDKVVMIVISNSTVSLEDVIYTTGCLTKASEFRQKLVSLLETIALFMSVYQGIAMIWMYRGMHSLEKQKKKSSEDDACNLLI